MFSSKSSCNYLKLRTNLRLCINRLKLLEKKKTELALKARKEIADYISAGKDDRARIRVEHIVREDYMVEAMEIIEMFCDLLLARFGLIEKMKEMDPGIEEAIATVIWAAPRLSADVQEIREVAKQFTSKYGKEYAEMCARNGFENVNEKVMHKMSIAAPPKVLIENYMIEIAKTYKVPFEPDETVLMEEPPEVTDLINLDSGSAGSGSATYGFESYENEMNERKKPPFPPGGGGSFGGGGGGGLPVMHPSAPSSQSAPSSHYSTPQLPPGATPVFPPPEHQGPVPPYQPPAARQPPPIPSRPPNAGHSSIRGPPPNSLPGYDEAMRSVNTTPPQQTFSPAGGVSGGMPDTNNLQLPEVPGLPSVPSSTLGGASAGGDDIDFDDLTRRFQDLKNRK